jgi:GNAT superfamily N-acetyltransferase
MSSTDSIVVRPVTPGRLDDLGDFAEANGKFGYCSCMKWRMSSTEFKESTREERAAGLNALVGDGAQVGLLAYLDDRPVGWASLAPRGAFEGLRRSRTLPAVDDSTWVILCFYVVAGFRGRGVQHALLEAAVTEASAAGADELVGYPVPSDAKLYRYMGSVDVFTDAGFEESRPKGSKRLVMRRSL